MSKETNIRFIWDNLSFDKATLSASSEDSSWPVTNLQTDDPAEAFKTQTLTGPLVIDIDLLFPAAVDCLSIIRHNLQTASKVVIDIYNDQARNTKIASFDYFAYTSLFGYGEKGYGEAGYGGVPVGDDLDLFPRLTRVLYFEEHVAQYFRVTIDNKNSDSSYQKLYIGRLFLAHSFIPKNNYTRGDEFQLVDPSLVTSAYAGNLVTDSKDTYYTKKITFKHMTKGEAYGQLLRLINRYGKRRPLVIHFVPEANDPEEPYTVMYGRFLSTPIYRGSNIPGRVELSLNFREEL